jgi:hypothetical protein
VVLRRENTKIKLWKEEYKSEEIDFNAPGAGGLEKVYDLTDYDQHKAFVADLWGEEDQRWVEGNDVSTALKDTGLTLIYQDNAGVDVVVDHVNMTVFDLSVTECPSGWMPKGGSEDNTVTITATIDPSSLTGTIKFTLYDVSDEPGYCLNRPVTIPGTGEDSDSWKDLQFVDPQTGFAVTGSNKDVATTTSSVSSSSVDVTSYDYGSYGKIKAEAKFDGDTTWCVAQVTGGTEEFVRVPRDDNTNDISDAWAYDTGNKTDDGDTSLNNSHNGDGLTRYQEYRGVDIDGDGDVSGSERLNPSRKDLFVQGSGFGGSFPNFAWGNAFNEAQIDVREFIGTVGTNDRDIDVLVVEAYNGTAPNNSGNIGRSGAPVAGVRQWYFSTHGQSGVGTSSQYGCDISYTRVYKVAINNRFNQKPHVDNNTWTAAGVWGGAANGVLDPVNPERVEDTDDDGVLGANEKDGSATAPHDDGDTDFDGDYPVKSGGGWEFTHDLTPHDIDNDGSIELPLVAKVSDIINDYTKAHVVMRTVNHEMGHSTGISGPFNGHCSDITCAMFRGIPNYNRHGHFCNGCRAMIRIHNN